VREASRFDGKSYQKWGKFPTTQRKKTESHSKIDFVFMKQLKQPQKKLQSYLKNCVVVLFTGKVIGVLDS